MKRWIGLYIALFLAAVGILSCAAGLDPTKEVSFGAVSQEGGYASQVIRTDAHEYVLYQNPEQEKFSIAKTEKALQDYETVGTLHYNGVYMLYRYEEEGKQYFGIEPIGEAKGEEEWTPIVFQAEGSFFAAGSMDDILYCSILGEDGRTITEYMLPAETMAAWEERMYLNLPEGHFAVSGAYEGDTLWIAREDGVIYRRTEIAEQWSGGLEETPLAAALEQKIADGAAGTWRLRNFTEGMEQMLLPSIAVALLVLLVLYGWRKQNHIVYRVICCTGILSLGALLYAGFAITEKLVQREVLETGIEAGHVLEAMRNNQRADGTVDPDAYWAAMQQREGLLEDLLILKPETGKVLLAKELPAGVEINGYYGVEAQALALQAAAGNEALMMRLPKGDTEVYAVAMRDWRSMNPDSVLLAVLSADGIQRSISVTLDSVYKIIGGLMAVSFLIHVGLFALFGKRWKKFVDGISYVATEKKTYPEIPQGGDGLQNAWVPLDSIGNNLSKLYYERELLYRRYYRFVPKDMERLLKKPELADIEIGDRNQINGCMAYFLLENMKNINPSEFMDVMTKSLELMHEVRVKRDGIFLSAGMDLQQRKIFFENSARNALQFSVDLLHTFAENTLLAENDMIFLLHAAEFQYGISGVKDMTTPYMYSAQEGILEPYAKLLAKTKVKIAMTEQTMRLIGDGFSTRYIGFISGGEEYGSLKLYECLDAYPENQRKRILQTEVMFQRALQLFYSNDFYLARNTFNEVLKINERDHIARWYLFHCEYHLNKPEAEVSYGLFENIVLEQEHDQL